MDEQVDIGMILSGMFNQTEAGTTLEIPSTFMTVHPLWWQCTQKSTVKVTYTELAKVLKKDDLYLYPNSFLIFLQLFPFHLISQVSLST